MGPRVAIIGRHKSKTTSGPWQKTAAATVSNKDRVAKCIQIPPMHQAVAIVVCNQPGLLTLERDHTKLEHHLNMMAKRIVNNKPNQTFQVCLRNLSNHMVQLPKNKVVWLESFTRRSISTRTPQRSSGELHAKGWGSKQTSGEEEPTTPVSAETVPTPNGSTNLKEDITIGSQGKPCKDCILDLLDSFSTICSGYVGVIKGTQQRIELVPEVRPIHYQPCRAGPKGQEVEIQKVKRMLKKVIIIMKPAYGKWARPVVLLQKMGDAQMFCMVYRKQSAITASDSYLIIRMGEVMDSLRDVELFTTLDANCGHWQVKILKEKRDKTTFICKAGLFRFSRIPFGFRYAPAIFRKDLNIFLYKFI